MYSCYDCHLVYGWKEIDRSIIIDEEWLDTEFEGEVAIFAEDVVRNTVGIPVYGAAVEHANARDGVACNENPYEVSVMKIFKKIMKLRGEDLNEAYEKYSFGYHIAISGDFEQCQDRYIPGE